MIQYAELQERWRALRAHGVSVREVACVGAARTMLIAELGGSTLPCISISAGVHGDEPGGPAALLSLAEDGLLDPRYSYRLWPCTNPTGYLAQTRTNAEGQDINRSFSRGGTTPESKAIITANRDRRFVFSLDLHEDVEGSGFYCYERAHAIHIARRIISALDEAGLPVQQFEPGFDLGYPPDAESLCTIERGLVIPNVEEEMRYFSGMPYSLYVGKAAAQRVLTLESPGTREWTARLAIHRVAVVAAIEALAKV